MRKKKIAVVGKGTAGSQALIHFARYFSDQEIVWYFDPSKPTQSVGEGASLAFPENLFNNIGFSHNDLEKVNGTFKTGIYKENWGTANKSFFHDFPPPSLSYHFSAVELQNYIETMMEDKVEIVRKSVDYNNVDADFVLNATGASKDLESFSLSEYIPVNAAYITQCYWDSPTFNYSLNIAAKHGWVFGIPLKNRCSIGYLYNNKINTKEEIQEDVKEFFEKYNLTPSDQTNSLSFNNYYRKNNYEHDGRLVHSGNASFFLEPLEATSIAVMNQIQRTAFDLWTGQTSVSDANSEYTKSLKEIELMIMMHYAAGSPFKTKFWDYAQERGIKKLEESSNDKNMQEMYSYVKDIDQINFAVNNSPIKEYGTWWAGSFVQNISGLGVSDTMNNIFNTNANIV